MSEPESGPNAMVHLPALVHNITGFRGQVITQEHTKMTWTLTFQRVGR